MVASLGPRDMPTGKQSTPLMTADQFLTMAANPRLQDAIDKIETVIGKLR